MSTPSRRIRRYVPPQHGAWAMVLLPLTVGILATRPVIWHLPLTVAALSAYPLTYYALLAVKTGRPARVAAPLRLYTTVSAICGAVVLAARPALLWFGPAFAVLLAVNAVSARRRADRGLLNGLASICAGCLFGPIAAVTAGAAAGAVLVPTALVAGYFAGSLLHVKTMIRNAGDPRYRRASVTAHLALLAAAAWVNPWLCLPFGALLVRAVVLPAPGLRGRVRPAVIGIIELAACLVLAVCLPALA